MTAKPFIHDDFLLETPTARTLYHDYAAAMPILDYHCHLPPQEVAGDRRWENLAQVWLGGDHYKWRLLRANGVDERLITGDAPDRAKFDAFAATMPYLLRNPMYDWSHLELARYFGITDLLSPRTAGAVWERANAELATPACSASETNLPCCGARLEGGARSASARAAGSAPSAAATAIRRTNLRLLNVPAPPPLVDRNMGFSLRTSIIG